MISFPVMTQDEIQLRSGKFFAEGEATFEVENYLQTVSKAGNPMVVVDFRLTDSRGKKGTRKDYFVLTVNASWKLFDFLSALGLEEQYYKGEVDFNELIFMSGKCNIVYRDEQPVLEYISKKVVVDPEAEKKLIVQTQVYPDGTPVFVGKTKVNLPPTTEIADDDIPF